ncbi:MAG TPA: hypothetical protein V6D07_19060 [Trichocoleus sp.]
MKQTFKGIPSAFPSPTVNVVAGGGSVGYNGNLHFWIQGRNRQGYNDLSSGVVKAIAATDKIDVIIPGTCRPNPDGSDIQEILVLASTANTPSTATVIAAIPGTQALPYTLSLTSTDHIAMGTDQILANVAALPSSPLPGMRRQVDAWGEIRAYSAESLSWKRVEPQLFSTYVADIDSNYGCRQSVSLIPNPAAVYKVAYGASGSQSTEIAFWLINDASVSIPAGTGIDLNVEANGQDVSASINNGALQIAFRGYVDQATAVLDISSASGTGNMPGVGDWLDYPGTSTGLMLPKDLPAGSAYCLSLRLDFTETTAGFSAAEGTQLGFSCGFNSTPAERSTFGLLTGSIITGDQQQRRIVPGGIGLVARALAGTGIVKVSDSNAYVFLKRPLQEVAGLSTNQDDQPVYISAQGNCFVSSSPGTVSVLRALVGTVDGVGNAIAWPSILTLNNATQVKVTLTYPTTIRPNYPDAIAGSNAGVFNATFVRVYFLPSGGGNSVYWDFPITPGVSSETFTLSTAGTSTGSPTIPSAIDSRFGLYEQQLEQVAVTTQAGASGFSSGTGNVYVAFGYESTITSIDHRATSGCIPESAGSMSDLFEIAKFVGAPQEHLGGLRLVPSTLRHPYKNVYVASEGNPFRWDSDEVSNKDVDYGFSDLTSAGATTGQLRLNHASINLATKLFVSATDLNGDAATLISQIAASQSLRLDAESGSDNWAYFQVSGTIVSNSGYSEIPVTYVGHSGSFASGDQLMLSLGNQYVRPFDLLPTEPGRWVLDDSTQLIPLSGSVANNAVGENGDWGLATNEASDIYGDLYFKAAGVWNWAASILSYSKTTQPFVMPTLLGAVTIDVRNSRPFPTGSYVLVQKPDGTEGGVFQVSGKPSNGQLSLVNQGSSSGVAAGATVGAGSIVYVSGKTGTQGINSVATVQANFTQPNEGASVQVTVNSALGFAEGQYLYSDAGSGSTYRVIDIPTSTTLELYNLPSIGNSVSGTTIPSGTKLVPSGPFGPQGIQGPPGVVTATSGVNFTEIGTSLTTAAGVSSLFVDLLHNLKLREPSDGPIRTVAVLEKTQTYTQAQSVTTVVLTDGAVISVDASASNVFRVTIAGNRQVDNPTNLTDGETLLICVIQDGTGGRTLTWGANYDFGTDGTPTLSTAAGKMDILSFLSNGSKLFFCGIKKGFTA